MVSGFRLRQGYDLGYEAAVRLYLTRNILCAKALIFRRVKRKSSIAASYADLVRIDS